MFHFSAALRHLLLAYFDSSWQLRSLFHCLPPPSPPTPNRPENENCGSNQPSRRFAPSLTLRGNYLPVPCPLTEALSRGEAGNQINCMSANRITSSLTRRESALKAHHTCPRERKSFVVGGRRGGAVRGGGRGLPRRRGTPSLRLAPTWLTQPTCQVVCESGGFLN